MAATALLNQSTTNKFSAWGVAGLVFLIALAAYFPYPLNTPLAATEGHRAMTAHQMVESGEWLVPRLYGRVYGAKPPLHYWILATSETLFQTTSPWVWRLPGAIEGALLAAILCLFANRWFGRIAGLVSGLSYVALFTLWGENRGADIDVTNTLTATLACLCLIEIHLGRPTLSPSHGVPPAGWDEGSAQVTQEDDRHDSANNPQGNPLPKYQAVKKDLPDLAHPLEYATPENAGSAIQSSRVPLGPLPALRFSWLIAAGLAIAASLMVKGPASLTIIFGAYLALIIVLKRGPGWAWLSRLATWLPLLIGIALFATYLAAAFWYCKAHHLVPDLSGVQEGTQDLHPHSINLKRIVEWVLLPPTMFVFALPVSLSLLFGLRREVRGEEPVRARLMFALALAVLCGWGICFISGMHLPRYAFVTLPLLCPLAGGVASRLPMLRPEADHWMRVIVTSTAVVFCVAALVLAGMVFRVAQSPVRTVLIVVASMAIPLTVITVIVILRGKSWRGAWGVPAIVLLVSIVFAIRGHYDRLHRSSIPQAQLIRAVAGDHATLITCAMVLDQPDLFYYSGLTTHAMDGDNLDWRQTPLNSWVVLEPQELKIWQAEIPSRIWRETPFEANRNKGILLWYGDTAPPAPSVLKPS